MNDLYTIANQQVMHFKINLSWQHFSHISLFYTVEKSFRVSYTPQLSSPHLFVFIFFFNKYQKFTFV